MKNTKPNSKKEPTEMLSSSPEAKASRLKRLRNLANLSRKEICESSNINMNTYKGWELARFGGLTVEGAEKIINRVSKAGIMCTAEWLLHGKYPAPTLSLEKPNEEKSAPESLVEREFSVYKTCFNKAVLEKVADDSLLPNIKEGDFVAGIKHYGEEIDLIIDKLCIIQTSDGKKLIRYLKRGNSQGLYSLLCANPFSNSADLVILNIKLIFAAPITRHYMMDEN